jgi:hypothetical protein
MDARIAAVTPQKFDQDCNEDGCLKPTASVTTSMIRAWAIQVQATTRAVL